VTENSAALFSTSLGRAVWFWAGCGQPDPLHHPEPPFPSRPCDRDPRDRCLHRMPPARLRE